MDEAKQSDICEALRRLHPSDVFNYERYSEEGGLIACGQTPIGLDAHCAADLIEQLRAEVRMLRDKDVAIRAYAARMQHGRSNPEYPMNKRDLYFGLEEACDALHRIAVCQTAEEIRRHNTASPPQTEDK